LSRPYSRSIPWSVTSSLVIFGGEDNEIDLAQVVGLAPDERAK